MKISKLLKKINSVIDRLDVLLPPEQNRIDWSALAYRWQSIGKQGILESLPNPHTFPLNRLAAVNSQTERLKRNTEQFLSGRPANNVLMSGARGTGKSSLVKALLHEYSEQGLRLIEVDKSDLISLPALLTLLEKRKEKFIVFCDDLSFESGDETYKALKTALDGGLSQRCNNVLVYATSNRRHLYPFDQNDYLLAVENWLNDFEVPFDETAKKAALMWAQMRGNRSGRSAWQFACDWAGRLPEQRILD